MGIIDFLYFRFVALRQLKKAYQNSVVQIRIKPDFQAVKDKAGDWMFSDGYKMTVKIGVKEYRVASESLRGLLKELRKLVEDR